MMKAVSESFPPLPISPHRFVVYIDGYNLYCALNHHDPRHLFRLCWCNYQKLGEALVTRSFKIVPRGSSVEVKYFTAKVDRKVETPGEAERQELWLKALSREAPAVKVVYGLHVRRRKNQREEKQTDVNIALHLTQDLIQMKPAGIVLLSGDLDFQPIVKHTAEQGVPISVFVPEDHKLYNLEPGATYTKNVRINHLAQDVLKECRLSYDDEWLTVLKMKVEKEPKFARCLEYENDLRAGSQSPPHQR